MHWAMPIPLFYFSDKDITHKTQLLLFGIRNMDLPVLFLPDSAVFRLYPSIYHGIAKDIETPPARFENALPAALLRLKPQS